MANAMGLQVSDQTLLEVFLECYGHCRTFVTGKVGTWKKYFTEEHKALSKELFGDLLIELGYDYSW